MFWSYDVLVEYRCISSWGKSKQERERERESNN
jgi:hypothetical protein